MSIETTTPQGFISFEVDVEPEILHKTIVLWVEEHLHPASVELFNERLADGIEQALHDAVLNDAMMQAVTVMLEKHEEKDED